MTFIVHSMLQGHANCPQTNLNGMPKCKVAPFIGAFPAGRRNELAQLVWQDRFSSFTLFPPQTMQAEEGQSIPQEENNVLPPPISCFRGGGGDGTSLRPFLPISYWSKRTGGQF